MYSDPGLRGRGLREAVCLPVNRLLTDFPGSPVVETSPSNAGCAGSIPG